MNDLTTVDRAADVRAFITDGRAERLRKRFDGPRSAAAQRLGVDAITLFRYEKGRSAPVGERLRIYHEYLQGLAAREAMESAT